MKNDSEFNRLPSKSQGGCTSILGQPRDGKKKADRSGKSYQGERAGATAGKNMDGFRSIIVDVVRSNGLEDGDIMLRKKVITLPGFFRPTKQWIC